VEVKDYIFQGLTATANNFSVMHPDTSRSDAAGLVAAAREDDHAAFHEMYRNYSRMVHGILLARVPYQAVEDLVQDVFLQAYRQLPRLRDPAAVGGWLAAIARNLSRDHFRRARETSELTDTHAAPGNPATTAEAAAALAVIRGLPEAYRETLILRLVEGMTGQEIAERTGLSPGSVRVNLHRGMKLLRERLERRNPHASA
jgi:RNA polymerase sigma-70 factor, ECF subfamily